MKRLQRQICGWEIGRIVEIDKWRFGRMHIWKRRWANSIHRIQCMFGEEKMKLRVSWIKFFFFIRNDIWTIICEIFLSHTHNVFLLLLSIILDFILIYIYITLYILLVPQTSCLNNIPIFFAQFTPTFVLIHFIWGRYM